MDAAAGQLDAIEQYVAHQVVQLLNRRVWLPHEHPVRRDGGHAALTAAAAAAAAVSGGSGVSGVSSTR